MQYYFFHIKKGSQCIGSGWIKLVNADVDITTTSDSNFSVCFGYNLIAKEIGSIILIHVFYSTYLLSPKCCFL